MNIKRSFVHKMNKYLRDLGVESGSSRSITILSIFHNIYIMICEEWISQMSILRGSVMFWVG